MVIRTMAYFGTLMTLSSNLETEQSEIASTELAVAMQGSLQSCSSGQLDPYVSRNNKPWSRVCSKHPTLAKFQFLLMKLFSFVTQCSLRDSAHAVHSFWNSTRSPATAGSCFPASMAQTNFTLITEDFFLGPACSSQVSLNCSHPYWPFI